MSAAAATVTSAEVAIFKGAAVAGGNASLIRVGVTDVSSTFNTVGRMTTTVALSRVAVGDDL